MSDKRVCSVFKSLREDEMYLFVDREEGLTRVPAPLMERFGQAGLVTTLVLTPQRKLARADASGVLAAIAEKGFYLQMPPAADAGQDQPMWALNEKNQKLPR